MTATTETRPLYAEKPRDCVCHKCPQVRLPTDFCGLCPVHGVKSDLESPGDKLPPRPSAP